MNFSDYPNAPGWKATDTETSRQAAVLAKPQVATLREQCLDVLRVKPMTADEVASELLSSVLSIRPRISELKLMGRVEQTPRRRCNVSGRSAVVWRLALAQAEMNLI